MTTFHTSSRCGTGGCVELAYLSDGGVVLRSTRRPDQPLDLDPREWADFQAAIRAGEFDQP